MRKDVVTIEQKTICAMCKGKKYIMTDSGRKPCLCQRKGLLTKSIANARTDPE